MFNLSYFSSFQDQTYTLQHLKFKTENKIYVPVKGAMSQGRYWGVFDRKTRRRRKRGSKMNLRSFGLYRDYSNALTL